MQDHTQEEIDSRSEPSPMAIIGAILAQGAIRCLDRQKREQRVAQKSSETSASRLSTNPGLRNVLIQLRQQGWRLWQSLPRQGGGRRRHAVAGQHAQSAMVEHGRTWHRTFVALCMALLVERRLWFALGGAHRHPGHGAALAPGPRTRDRGGQSRQQHRAQQPQAEPAQLGRSPGH